MERIVVGSNANQPLALPDGGKPLPLGSGYISALLGSGAMSNVYKIWNPQLETFRAVKLMKPDVSADSRQRFQTEMKIMAALSHPNIIEIHSVGEWNGLSFIEMEYIEGFTLAEIIEKKGALPLPVCTALGTMVSQALVYAHDKDYVLFGKSYHGIIHRDLKPSNLMVSKDGRVKLMDFGIARPVESSLMTMDGAVMGTMQYLAPEQIDGKNVGVAVDIYALGVVLYEMLTGHKAFPHKNLSQLMAAKMENNFVPLKSYKMKIPGPLRNVVNRCMMYEAKKRTPSAAAALSALQHVHRLLTLNNTEEVIRSFLSSPINEKTVLVIRKPLPIRAIASVCAVVIMVTVGITLLAPHGKRNRQISEPAAPSPAVIGTVPTSGGLASPPPPDSVKKPASVPDKTKTQKPSAPKVVAGAGALQAKRKPAETETNRDQVNFIELFIQEAEAGNFEKALQLFNKLPRSVAVQKNAQLLRLRALHGLGRTVEASSVMNSQIIDDGEYYLIKAKYLYGRGSYDQSLKVLEKGITVRAQLLDAEIARRDYLHCRALCLSRRFDQEPSNENRKSALDGWFEVKNAVRKFPHHLYFNEAVSEMQRIGDASQAPSSVAPRKEGKP